MPVDELLLGTADVHRWRACHRRFWLLRHRPAPSAGAFDDGSFEVGPDKVSLSTTHVDLGAELDPETAGDESLPSAHAALRATFPLNTVIVPPADESAWAVAVTQTHQALRDLRLLQEDAAIFGACLESADGVRVRIDVLGGSRRGLRLFKLRLSTVASEADVDAAALWAHVAAHEGLRLASVGVLLVNTEFIYPGHACYAGLFREYDLTPVLGSRPVPTWLVAMRQSARGPCPDVPSEAPCFAQGGCECLSACEQGLREAREVPHDAGPGAAAGQTLAPARPSSPGQRPAPDALSVLGRELAAELQAEGHATLKTVPLSRVTHPRHRRALQAVQAQHPVVEPALGQQLRALPYPRHFLRIDTIGFAVPVWPGTRPYEIVPFQWTCETEHTAASPEAPAAVATRRAFLAGPGGDPRRAFALSLLSALGEDGPVLAYNAGFERNRLRELAQRFDDLAPALDRLGTRLVDLFPLARAHFYHPAMCGSWSFRSLCDALVPSLAADDCLWRQDRGAPAVFARSLSNALSTMERDEAQAVLRLHGERQTAALRALVALWMDPV